MLPELFWAFFQIGAMSIGGGYAAMPLIRSQTVDLHGWLTMTEFADLITIAEMTPGPIAINGATFVGTQVAGLPGAIVATLGCVLPSSVIVLILAFLYNRYRRLTVIQGILSGLRPAVVALIASAGLSILLTALWGSSAPASWIHDFQIVPCLLFLGALAALKKFKLSPIAVMLGCGGLGIILHLLGLM